jgi:HlyD family secretion protein
VVRRILFIGLPVAIVLALWAFASTRPVRVELAKLQRGPVRSFVEEEGKTRVIDRFVVSTPVGGRLRRVRLDEGDAVKKGAVLAEIDSLEFESKVAETEAEMRALRHRIEGVDTKKPKRKEVARARLLVDSAEEALSVAERELDDAEARAALAKKDADRLRVLARDGSATTAELDATITEEIRANERVRVREIQLKIRRFAIDSAKLTADVLEARLKDYRWEKDEYKDKIEAMEASLKSLRDDLQRTRILSPTDGVVLNLLRESEQFLAAGTPILEVGDLERLEVEADFLSEDVAHMKVGMKAEIFGRALGDRVVPAKLTHIYPSAFRKISSLGVEQQRVKVVVRPNPGGLGLGDRFRVEVRVILEERADALLLPEGALFRSGGRWQVFRVDGGRAKKTAIRTGLRDGRLREVLEGLSAGDSVILHPDPELEDGTRVEALP